MGLIQLKRTAATTIENVPGKGSYRIRAEISPVRWLTIELQMRSRELREYTRIYHFCTGYLSARYDDIVDNPLRNMAYHRKLYRAVMTPDLNRISSSAEGPQVIEKFYHKHNNHRATYYFNSTKPQATLPVYRDRPSMAYYLTRDSTKVSYLAKLVCDIYTQQRRKVIVFCDWPSTSWLVEVLMLVLGLNVMSIRAKHKLKEREEAVAAAALNSPSQYIERCDHCAREPPLILSDARLRGNRTAEQ